MIQVGDLVGQWPERCGLVQGAVRPVGVVEGLVLAQDGHQVALVPEQGPVQQFPAATAYPAFDDRVGSHHQRHPIQMIGSDVSG
jgi:hypothetical protein